MISSDLSLEKHVIDTVCSKCFFCLRQLKRVRRSLDAESMKTLVHAFVTSRVDYGNIILVGAPKSVIDKLQRVLNAGARIVTGTRKYDRGLSHLLHTKLHWLDVQERVLCKLALTVHRYLQHKAPQYLSNCCVAVSEAAICRSSSASTHPTISSQNIRPSCFCCGWLDVLELTGRWAANLL